MSDDEGGDDEADTDPYAGESSPTARRRLLAAGDQQYRLDAQNASRPVHRDMQPHQSYLFTQSGLTLTTHINYLIQSFHYNKNNNIIK